MHHKGNLKLFSLEEKFSLSLKFFLFNFSSSSTVHTNSIFALTLHSFFPWHIPFALFCVINFSSFLLSEHEIFFPHSYSNVCKINAVITDLLWLSQPTTAYEIVVWDCMLYTASVKFFIVKEGMQLQAWTESAHGNLLVLTSLFLSTL